MDLFDLILKAYAVVNPAAAPAVEGTEKAKDVIDAAKTTADIAQAANAANAANTVNAVNTANVAGSVADTAKAVGEIAGQGNAVPGIAGISQGVGQGIAGNVAPNFTNAAQSVASTAPNAAADAVQNAAVTQGTTGINFNPASNYTPPNPNLVQVPGQYANFDLTKTASEYSPLSGSAAQAGINTIPTTVSDAPQSALERGFNKAVGFAKENPFMALAGAKMAAGAIDNFTRDDPEEEEKTVNRHPLAASFRGNTMKQNPYKSGYSSYAEGGIAALANGGMGNGGMGNNQGYPQGRMDMTQYATPTQMPISAEVVRAGYEPMTNPYSGSPIGMAKGGIARYAEGSIADGGLGQVSRGDSNTIFGPSSSPTYSSPYSDSGMVFQTPANPMAGYTPSSPQPTAPRTAQGINPYLQEYQAAQQTPAPKPKTADAVARGFLNNPVFGNGMNSYGFGMGGYNPYGMGYNPFGMVQSIFDEAPKTGVSDNFMPQDAAALRANYTPYSSGYDQYAAGGSAKAKGMAYDEYINQMGGGSKAKSEEHTPDWVRSVGIHSESDPDFVSKSAFETAAGRLKKLYSKTHISPQGIQAVAPSLGTLSYALPNEEKKPTPEVEMAAKGGILGAHYDLGGYAAGGNPRLLKGPGDGMSDNIPAIIGDRQPARLADGEFVIPADVVSHLGNGSTEAGAKHLHSMMDRVRKARTGNKKQGKQINPSKFMPK